MPLNDNMRGALLMTAATAGFACNDALMKLAFETVPVAQGIFCRGLVAIVLIGLLAWRTGALRCRPSRREWRVLALRTGAELGATVTFLQAISMMPLAAATSVLQFVPLAVTMVAALLLSEPVGWRRWSAIAVGFLGVLVMMRPGTAGFEATLLYPMATVVFITARDVLTRYMEPATPSVFVSFLTILTVTFFAGVAMPIQGAVAIDLTTAALFVIAASFIMVGYIMSVTGMRVGDISAVSPFRYTVLVWAMLLGFLLFEEVPDTPTLIGAGMVVAAGLYTLWRETRRGPTRTAAEASTRPFSPTGRGP